MANRREFLQLSAATLGIMAAPVKTLAGMTPSAAMPFYKVIYDERFEDCVAFAHEARRLGAATHGIRDDVTDLWYGDLRRHLSVQPGLIAGLTTASSAFLLEQLGHDVFHHQVFRGEHKFSNAKLTGHHFEVPEYIGNNVTSLTLDREHWGKDLAVVMSHYDTTRPTFPRTLINAPRRHDGSTANLVSWVIAPLKKV